MHKEQQIANDSVREKGIHSMNRNNESHREFPVIHDISLRCVVTYNRLSFNTYYDC